MRSSICHEEGQRHEVNLCINQKQYIVLKAREGILDLQPFLNKELKCSLESDA